MTGYIGVLSRNGRSINSGKVKSACHDFVQLSKQPVLQQIVEKQNFWATAFSRERSSESIIGVDAEAELTLIGHVDIYNRSVLCEQLHLKEQITDSVLLLHAYKKWGKACVRYINGDFSFAICNAKDRSVFLAKDPLGQRPLFYYCIDGFFAFANWMQLLSNHDAAKAVDAGWITDLLLFNKRGADRTAFKNIKSLPAAHILTVTADKFELEQYWDITRAKPMAVSSYEEAVAGMRLHLTNAIENRLGKTSQVGVELSGGIDSVSVATLAQNILTGSGNRIHAALTNSLPEAHRESITDFHDERSVAVGVSRNLGINKHIAVEDYLTGIHNSLERVLDVQGVPSTSIFGVSQENLFSTASGAGVSALLSGFGGNEVVTEYATDRYRFNLARDRQFGRLYKSFKKPHVRCSAALKSTGYFYGSYLYNVEKKRYAANLDKLLSQSLLKDDLLAEAQPSYDPTSFYYPNQTIEERCLSQIRHPSMSNRIESGYFFASCHYLTYMHPLLDIPLIEYYYHLLPEWKVTDPRGRGIFRAAMKGSVPDDILFAPKSGQTATFPFYRVHFANNFENLKAYVLSLPRGKQIFDYVDRKKIEKLQLPPDNSKYPYYLLRMVVMTDLFFDRRKGIAFHELS